MIEKIESRAYCTICGEEVSSDEGLFTPKMVEDGKDEYCVVQFNCPLCGAEVEAKAYYVT